MYVAYLPGLLPPSGKLPTLGDALQFFHGLHYSNLVQIENTREDGRLGTNYYEYNIALCDANILFSKLSRTCQTHKRFVKNED